MIIDVFDPQPRVPHLTQRRTQALVVLGRRVGDTVDITGTPGCSPQNRRAAAHDNEVDTVVVERAKDRYLIERAVLIVHPDSIADHALAAELCGKRRQVGSGAEFSSVAGAGDVISRRAFAPFEASGQFFG